MAASIVLIKTINYRGANEEWSNKYHFDGGAPADQAKWLTFANAVWAEERKIFTNAVNLQRVIGYTADGTPADFAWTNVSPGTLVATGGSPCPGDCATWIRWTTARHDSRGHPVYLRNYYHNAYYSTGGQVDLVLPLLKVAMETYGSTWTAGHSDGSVTHKRTGPDSLGATGRAASTFISRRKLKRRG